MVIWKPINTLVAWVAVALIVDSASAQLRAKVFDSPWMGYDTSVYPEGINPWAARVADFDADGVPDLATVSWGGTSHLSLLFGDGAGGYLPPVIYPIVAESLGLEVADFDADGDPDILVCDTGRFWEGQTLSLFRNNGTGVMVRHAFYNTIATGPSGITASDFNGDGFTDIATANDRYIVFGNTVSILLNNGSGTLVASQVLTLAEGTRSIASGDIDGDGDVDLVVGHETNIWTLVRNNGAGVFGNPSTYPGLSSAISEQPAVHVADIDADNDLDVFYSNMFTGGVSEGGIGLYRNPGQGGFGAGEMIPFNWGTGGSIHTTTADVTGDGWLDILAASGASGNWFLVPGDGVGGFGPAQRFRAGEQPISMHAPDLDSDGDLDPVIVANGSNEACVYLNPGAGDLVQPVPIDMTAPTLAPAFAANLQTGDIDADGDLDLVAGYRADFAGRHGVSVRRNNGDGTFASIEDYRDSTYPVVIRLGDLDGDGDLDLAYLNSQQRVMKRLNRGDGVLGTAATAGTISSGTQFILHDVDADGDLDVVANGFFQITTLLNNGDSTFGAPKKSNTSGYFEWLAGGDFNNDGKTDALTSSGAQSSAAISFGQGNGLFAAPFEVPVGRDVHAFAPAFVDGDLNLDLCAEYNLDEKGLSMRRGRGDGNFFLGANFHGSYGSADHTSSLVIADADGDWRLDALTANISPQDFSLWRGAGDGTFELLERYGIGEQAVDLSFGDFDGDGIRDVAALTEVNVGTWWYPGVILIRGIRDEHPRSSLVLRQSALRRSQAVTFIMDGLAGGEQVTLIYSTRNTGSFYCPPGTGGLCLDLIGPVTVIGTVNADANGIARITRTVPANAPLGATVRTQAFAKRGPGGALSTKSNLNTAQITN